MRELTARFAETDYIVDDDPPIIMHVGEQHDGIRVLMASFDVESAAFITAWNPGGKAISFDENLDRQAGLLAEIETGRYNYFVGRGEHPVDGWSEDSYLVLGINQDSADALASQFEQAGYVWIGPDGVPQLRMLDPDAE